MDSNALFCEMEVFLSRGANRETEIEIEPVGPWGLFGAPIGDTW